MSSDQIAAAADGPALAADAEPAAANAAAAAEGAASTAAPESATPESAPSLLSSAAGKQPAQPAPAADAESEPDAKAADAPESGKDGGQPAKPDDPGKAKAEGKADAATDPAKDATAKDPPDQPPALSLEDLKFPEGMALDAEAGKAFVDLLNNAALTGKDRGQALIDLHLKEIDRVAQHIAAHQRKVWNDLNAGWQDQLRKDPELGGNRLDTTLSRAKAVIEEFLSPEDAKALLIHTDNNGMGNFPVFIRLLSNIGKRLNVFEDNIVAANPAPARSRAPGSRGWYDKSLNAGG
jgi:hypothetical protein